MNLPFTLQLDVAVTSDGPLWVWSWLCTYLLHSTLFGLVALIPHHLRGVSMTSRQIWQLAALVLPVLTTTATMETGSTESLDVTGAEMTIAPIASRIALHSSPWFRSETVTSAGWVLAAIWIAVVVVRAAGVFLGLLQLRHCLRGRVEVADPDVLQALDDLRRDAGVRHRVRLTHGPALSSPTLVNRGEICVPTHLLQQFAPDELRAVLAHEMAHVARLDWLWFPLVTLIDVALPGQPMNRWLARAFRRDAESSCDQRAVQWTGNPEQLARALLKVAQECVSPRRVGPVPTMASRKGVTLQRMEQLLAPTKPRARSQRWMAFGPLSFSFLVMPVGVALGHDETPSALTSTPPDALTDATERAERRHQLDVELQTMLWEWGVAEDAPEVLRLRREIEQLDRLETPSD